MYLKLEHINKSFGSHQVVKDLNFGVDKGQILCLLGASGCGKTTTLKMIGGFLHPDGGRILLDGEEITGIDAQRRPVSTVFQSYALFPNMTVQKNVMYGLKFRGYSRREAAKEAMHYLDLVGLADYAGAGIQEISGGQKQRVALARALVTRPKVLLLDEPLSNLDAKLRIKMREEIKALQRKFEITTVFVTHDQEEAMVIADQIGIMHEGKLTQVGRPEEVYLHPADDYTMNFLGSVNSYQDPSGSEIKCRPEDLQLEPAASAGGTEGTVVKSEFLGFYRQYYVRIGDDTVLIRGKQEEEYQPGETVTVKIKKQTK